MGHGRFGVVLAAILASSPAFAASDAIVCWSAETGDSGGYDYTFQFTTLSAGNWNWVVFSDYGPYGPTNAETISSITLTSLAPATFTGLSSSSGGHNGPTFLDTTTSSTTAGFYNPTAGTQASWTWTVHGTNLIADGDMYWSNLWGSGSMADYDDAPMDPGTGDDVDGDGTTDVCDPDADGDGSIHTVDCDDLDPLAYPGATEVCDGVDNDCDGGVDEGFAAKTYYYDSDGDSFGDPYNTKSSCDGTPEGYVTDDSDCDDDDITINVDAAETCDGVDEDCDGSIDDGFTLELWYADDDGDTYGDSFDYLLTCLEPKGYVQNDEDCDDDLVLVNPDGTESCNGIDDDCDGTDDDGFTFTTWWVDGDEDSYGNPAKSTKTCDGAPDGYVDNDDDCDDSDPDIYPGASQILDGEDNNCDDTVDDGIDDDRDGFADDAYSGGTDCDDTDAEVNPDAEEVANDIDDNCDGFTDEGTDAYDDDGDGFSEDDDDCDDADGDVNPGADEIPNGLDDDCDGLTDEGTDVYDDDEDGFSEEEGDCDDADPEIHPGAEEIPNSLDDDCDDETDEGIDDDADGSFYLDDCDDQDAVRFPGNEEVCGDDIDQDCDDADKDCAVPDSGAKIGCGCDGAGGPPIALFAALGGLALLRRRQKTGSTSA